ncbi:MAG: hypothetical protein M1823_005098 [Watsoniomyces obsoletus]|nr:MAG: hypothetical protein M1823_005098 [Watsoniomyces obsoletus]
MNEAELEKVFLPDFKVQSSRIIRDAQNHSKGVGFARFGSRDECDQIIKKFHGQPIGQEQLPLQVRYADTPEQKRLKHETQKRREFRANEYNSVAYGPSAMYSYRPIQQEILGAAIAGNRLRQMNFGWTGLPGPNFNSAVGRPIHIMDPTANFKSERPAEGTGKVESQNAGPHPNENAQVGITSPTIAHGDNYAPAVAASVAASA